MVDHWVVDFRIRSEAGVIWRNYETSRAKKNEAIVLGASSRGFVPSFFYSHVRVQHNFWHHTAVPPWGVISSSLARQTRGCQYRTIRLRKALGDTFPTPTVSAPALFSCEDIDHGESALGV